MWKSRKCTFAIRIHKIQFSVYVFFFVFIFCVLLLVCCDGPCGQRKNASVWNICKFFLITSGNMATLVRWQPRCQQIKRLRYDRFRMCVCGSIFVCAVFVTRCEAILATFMFTLSLSAISLSHPFLSDSGFGESECVNWFAWNTGNGVRVNCHEMQNWLQL